MPVLIHNIQLWFLKKSMKKDILKSYPFFSVKGRWLVKATTNERWLQFPCKGHARHGSRCCDRGVGLWHILRPSKVNKCLCFMIRMSLIWKWIKECLILKMMNVIKYQDFCFLNLIVWNKVQFSATDIQGNEYVSGTV